MNNLHISRRSFLRILAGLFAFIPAARSLTTFAANNDSTPPWQAPPTQTGAPRIISHEEFQQLVKTRSVEGTILALEGDSIWINDWVLGKLRLVITDDSIVWKGKYNKGKNFASYPHIIEPGDDVIGLGQRSGDDFFVEKMYVNILNRYITVDEVSLEKDKAVLSYSDVSRKKGIVEIRPDYLKYKAQYNEVISKRQQLRGATIQIIGLPLKDGTILATNVLFG